MRVVEKKLDDLIPYAKNAKRHDETQIANVAESIRQFGFVQPIVVDKNGVIVIGHCRALAAKRLGMEKVPCVAVDELTDEQVRALRIIDNKTNESPWDMELLAEELADIDLSGFDFDFGIDLPEESKEDEDKEIVEDEAPEVDEDAEPIAKLGDIWQLGRHRLMCGDSTDKATVELLMDGKKADLLLTDPPYGIDYGGLLKGKGDGHGGADKNGWKSYDAPTWDKERPNENAFFAFVVFDRKSNYMGRKLFCGYFTT